MSGHQKKEDARKKLREAGEPQVQGTLIDFVDLPTDGDGLHLRGEDNAKTCQLKKCETRVSEGNAPRGGGSL